MLKRKKVKIKDLEIEYFSGGKGPNLVFIHGLCLNPRNYMTALELLSNHFTVYAPSVPGHSNSDMPDDTSVENISEILYEFIKKLKIRNITLVGTSMGGLLSIYIASNHKKLVKKLVPVNTAGIVIKKPLLVVLILLLFDIIKEINSIKKIRQLLFDSVIWLKSIVINVLNLNSWAFVRELVHSDHTNTIKNVKTPTLILWAKGDIVLTTNHARMIQKLIKNSKLVLINNHSHHWVGLNQELFYETFIKNIL